MKGKKRIWIFTLAQLDTGVPHYRLVAPFDYFPRDEFEIIYAPSVKAILGMLFIPDVIVFQRILYPFREINKILKFAPKSLYPDFRLTVGYGGSGRHWRF